MEPSSSNITFEITTVQNGLQPKKLHCLLYMFHTPLGPHRNQKGVPAASLSNGFGSIVINDWPIYDGIGPEARVIARAQGQHIQAGIKSACYYNCLNIVFEDARFKGSTLQVMGIVVEEGEWAIVGGTGQFTLARGVIYKKFLKQNFDGNIMELDIHAFYAPFAKETGSVDCQ